MLRRAHYLKGYTIAARDGKAGTIKDFLFDDDFWTTRYLVVNTGGWLSTRKVLISPFAIEGMDPFEHSLDVRLTREQIESAPHLEEHQPVSRHYEEAFLGHYQWPYYWYGPELWGPAPVPQATEPASRENARQVGASVDRHLRSVNEVRGYYVASQDGDLGHIDDFIMDDADWAIRYLVIDTVNWWPGKKVLLPTHWVKSIEWYEKKIYVEVERETIKSAPPFDEATVMTRDYEEKLFAHYGRQGYWHAVGVVFTSR